MAQDTVTAGIETFVSMICITLGPAGMHKTNLHELQQLVGWPYFGLMRTSEVSIYEMQQNEFM